jgi:hypothetical protein
MPNGRSGGFVIETAGLKQLVTAVSDTEVVGQLTTGLRPRAASAAEVAQCIGECRQDRVAVEEQHNAFYIIHFSNDPDVVWLSVNSESPIFVELRRQHAQWMAEHPGWDGWIAF